MYVTIFLIQPPLFILSSERVLGNGVRTHVDSKGKNPLCHRPRGGSNPQCYIMQDSKPNTPPAELFRPPYFLDARSGCSFSNESFFLLFAFFYQFVHSVVMISLLYACIDVDVEMSIFVSSVMDY